MTVQSEEKIDPMTGSGAAMIAFLDLVLERGDMIPATASALRTGVKKVLDSEEALTSDMRNVEVDDLLRQFRNKNWGKLKEKSIEEYEKRFRQTVEMYRKWLNQEKDWLPARSRNTTPRKAAPSKASTAAAPAPTESRTPVLSGLPEVPHTGMVTYPIVIRAGVRGTIILPEDLTTKEAERVAVFVRALALEERLAITSGRTHESDSSPASTS